MRFRDRPLKKGEEYHWYCEICGQEVHQDLILSHKCNLPTPYPNFKKAWKPISVKDLEKVKKLWKPIPEIKEKFNLLAKESKLNNW